MSNPFDNAVQNASAHDLGLALQYFHGRAPRGVPLVEALYLAVCTAVAAHDAEVMAAKQSAAEAQAQKRTRSKPARKGGKQ